MIDFRTHPEQYRHWKLAIDDEIARLIMDVDPAGGLFDGYELKMNSYDLGVDIELNDAIQRLRFEHPQVRAVVMCSGKERIFCAGANIRMLGQASHGHKVNFCKFTNETRNSIEDASQFSKQTYLCAVNGPAAGGGYELALATDYILMADDGKTSVSLPEVSLLAVLPGTGGLTRVTDKRKVRRDRADIFSSTEEGVRGKRAVAWRLVDEVAPTSSFKEVVQARAKELAARSDRPRDATGIVLTRLERDVSQERIAYRFVTVEIDRKMRCATVTVSATDAPPPADAAGIHVQGDRFWPLALARELDDALLHLRLNEPEIASLILRSQGDLERVAAYDALLAAHANHWLAREIVLYWKRTLKRLDLTAKSLFALVEPGSCFAGFLAEMIFAADRSLMLDGQRDGDNRPPASIRLSGFNFAQLPMSNGLSRLATRFLGEPEALATAQTRIGKDLLAKNADDIGLTTAIPDDIDWDDEVRLMLEERAAYSPDALTGMEANLRFAGPETMETKIFGRLTAWQNWIFQRANAVGEQGALKLYGTGKRANYNRERV